MVGAQGARWPISNFWLLLMAWLFAMAFVLPNHYFPWTCFHAEALASAALLVPAIWVSLSATGPIPIYRSALVISLAALVAGLQYGLGLIPLWGTFWISAAYLLGMVLALQMGAQWEAQSPGQCLEYLGLAFVVAAVLSLPIEAGQWLDVPWSTPLLMQGSNLQRPFANMAQPNLLADLYLLAVVGVSWLHRRQRLPGWLAWTLVALFLLGAALTGSRAAWINVLALLLFYRFLRAPAAGRGQWALALGMAVLFFTAAIGAPKLQALLLDRDGLDALRQFSTESAHSRLSVWKMMGLASLQSPWFGYGWGQVIKVNFVFEQSMGVERGLFGQAHNLFLDLVLWNGYPLGILFALALVAWLGKLFCLERSSPNAHVLAAVALLCLHSLIEFPLYYSYFLFPACMLIGTVQPQLETQPVLRLHRMGGLAMLLAGLAVLVVTTRDYFAIERSFYALRYESRGYQTALSRVTPQTWALTQMEAHLRLSRSEPDLQATPAALAHMEDIVRATPGAYIMFKLALNYGLLQQEDKARFWLGQICNKSFVTQCDEAKDKWQQAREKYARIPLMPWPLP